MIEEFNAAKTKNLVIDSDFTNFEKVSNLYRQGFVKMLDSIIQLSMIDNKLGESPLSFSKYSNLYEDVAINSDFLRILNIFYVEKLTQEDISIFLGKETLDDDLVDIVKKTYKDVIYIDNVDTINYSYLQTDKELINGNIIMEVVYLKNKPPIENIYDDQVNFINELEVEINNLTQENLGVGFQLIANMVV